MKIGLDFDGTIADTTTTKIRYALETFGEALSAVETFGAGRSRLGEERHREMVQACYRGWTAHTEPMPDALEVISRLANEHELYVITARVDDEFEHARAWLTERAVPVVEVINTARAKKIDACRSLGIALMLDDIPTMLHDVAEAGIATALIEAEYNRDVERHPQTHLVRTWGEFEALVGRLAGAAIGER